MTAIEDLGSPYKEESGHLLDFGLDTIYPESVVQGILSIDKIGCDQIKGFFEKCIFATGNQLPLMETIHRNNIKLMSSKSNESNYSANRKLAAAKEEKDISMVILHALKAGRVIDESLFSRENRTYPPSLTTSQGEMYHGTKADLMHCLLKS